MTIRMTQDEAKKVLTKVFRGLPDKYRERLKYHYDKRTDICCGFDYNLYTDGVGGG